MRAFTLALAALTMLGTPAATIAPALADGIERPAAPAPARPRPRPRPAEPAPAPPPVIRESEPVPLAPPPAPPPVVSNELRLSDAFFMTPLSGGVGMGIGEGAVYGGGRVIITGGGATFSGAGRDLSAFRSHTHSHGGGSHHGGGGGGSCRRC